MIKNVFFDVNETLIDFSHFEPVLEKIGLSTLDSSLWFARVLQDGFALTLTQKPANFAQIGESVLTNLVQERGLQVSKQQISEVMQELIKLPPHPEVALTMQQLVAQKIVVATLSNGSVAGAEFIFNQLGIRSLISHVLSVQDTSHWKPQLKAYQYGLAQCQTSAAESVLVAVHPWDIHGANQAGLKTVWVNRKDLAYPKYFSSPTATIDNLLALSPVLTSL